MKQELTNLEHLITSTGWQQYRELIKEHKAYLQKEVNRAIRDRKFEDAIASLAKFDDIDKLFELLEIKIKQLKKEK